MSSNDSQGAQATKRPWASPALTKYVLTRADVARIQAAPDQRRELAETMRRKGWIPARAASVDPR